MLNMPMHGEIELPQFTLRQTDMPDVRYWEVGGEYFLVMKVEMVGKRVRKDLPAREDQTKVEGDFKMLNIRALGDEPIDIKTLQQQEFEAIVAQAKSGRA